MKKLLSLFLLIVLFSQAQSQTIVGRQNVDQYPITASGTLTYGLTWLPPNYATSTRSYPLIIFLHGSGETGTGTASLTRLLNAGIPKLISNGWNATAVNPRTGIRDSFIVVSPQAAGWSYNYTSLKHILPNIISRYRVDETRIYLTGLSAGGGGTFTVLGSNDSIFTRKFAAMATSSSAEVDGVNGYSYTQVEAQLRNAKRDNVHVWTVTGEQDYLQTTGIRYHDSTNKLNPAIPNKLTNIATLAHSTWNRQYDTAFRPTLNYYGNTANCTSGCPSITAPNNNGSPVMGTGVTQDSLNVYEWFLLWSRGQSFTVSAGPDQQITLPTNSTTLTATATASQGNSILSYAWTKISGPATFTIVSPSSASTSLTGLVAGTYTFRVTVTESTSTTITDDVVITVNTPPNQLPSANASPNQTITLPTNSVTFTGSGTDPDGTIASYQWTKLTGPAQFNIVSATAAQTVVNNLVQGVYSFELRVTDNQGGIGRDTVVVTVNAAPPPPNQLPSANAGANQTITLPTNSVTFTGSGIDPDGTISSYQWTKLTGPAQFNIVAPTAAQTVVNNLVQGVYSFELRVTDNQGGIGRDTVVVTVNAAPPANQAPTANAGPDQTITLPTNTVNLNGTGIDPDGSISTYAWVRISGPVAGTITSASSAITTVTGLAAGVYNYRLTVTDNNGAAGSDTVQITVNNASSCAGQKRYIVPNDVNGIYKGYYSSNPGFNPGDTIVIRASLNPWSYFGFGNVSGTADCPIVVINEGGQVQMKDGLGFVNCKYVKVIGTGSADQYGFKVQDTAANPGGVAINISGKSKNIEISNIFVNRKEYGCWIKNEADCDTTVNYPNWTLDSISVHHCYFRNMDSQGFYMGSTDPNNLDRPIICNGVTRYYAPTRLGNIKIYNNIVDSTGRPGIQLSGAMTGFNEIYNNTVSNTGFQYDDAQGTGISLGGYTRAYVHNNTVRKTLTWGIAGIGASGLSRIENNTIDSSGFLGNTTLAWPSSMSFDTRTTIPVDSTTIWVKNNILGAQGSSSYGIVMQDMRGSFGYDNVICNNIKLSNGQPATLLVASSIHYSTNCAAPPPNLPPTANAGADQTITLPTNTVNLIGSGSDPDGGIASFQWTKIAGPTQFTIVSATTALTAVNNLLQGVYQFELRVTDIQGVVDRDTVVITVNAAAPPNQLPSANAGANQTITLPTNSVTFTGSGTDPDGTIASYQWTKLTGPAQFNIVSATAAQTVVNNLVQGVYSFELRVTDNQGGIGRDTVVVTVNAAPPPPNQLPSANAGPNQTITLPTNSVTFTGSGTDPDGTISSYQWTKLTGPAQFNIVSATAAQTVVNNLVQGVYSFELRVTDNQGGIGRDTVVVTVNAAPPANQAPTANAGPDQTIILPTNTTTLNGSGTDPDGTIVSYDWSKISGPAQFVVVSPAFPQTVINNLVQGVYQFVLTVTDNQGATGRDTVVVTVNAAPPPPPPANQAPTANAGADQSITLPTNAVNFNGSGTDPDGTIASYQWTKITGPAQFNIVSASSAQTAVNSLVQGVYQFVLTVTDNQGATGRDTVVVTVNAAPPPPPPPANQAPMANAGIDQNITLPTNTVNLNGSGTDPDGTIVTYQWTKIAGPGQLNIVSASAAQTIVNNLVQGVYQFVLTVTDNQGANGRDTVVVTVNAAPPPVNQAPAANAGADRIITLPVNSVLISGNGTDPDGTIVTYRWTKISGPSQYTIAAPNQAQTEFTNLVQGVYEFELAVTDNQGAIARDIVRVTVEAEPQSISTAKIFPNPAVSTINIRIDAVTNANKTKITIVNMAGMIVFQKEVMRTQQVMVEQVDVSRFAKGSYVITIGLDINNSMTLLFIKK